MQWLKSPGVVPVEKVAAKPAELAERDKREFLPLEKLQRTNVTQIMRRDSREHERPSLWARCDARLPAWIFLKIIRGSQLSSGPTKASKKRQVRRETLRAIQHLLHS